MGAEKVVIGIIVFIAIAVGLIGIPTLLPNNINLNIWAPIIITLAIGCFALIMLLVFRE